MIKYILISFFISNLFLIYIFLSTTFKNKVLINKRFDNIFHENYSKQSEPISERDEELNKPFFERIIRPILKKFSNLSERTIQQNVKKDVQTQLMMAGNPWGLNLEEWIALKTIIMIGFTLVGIISYFGGFFYGLPISLGCAILIPRLILQTKIKKRQEEIMTSLPDFLDLLTVSVEAGLGFDSALNRVTEKLKGTLKEEITYTLEEIRLGKSKKEALRDLGKRTGVEDLITFISAIIQAEQLGVGMSVILRIQSDEIRKGKKRRAQEQAAKAPIKILFPLIFFIFPSLFIIIIGPAMINLMESGFF